MAELPPPEQVWQRSTVTEEHLHRMVKEGVLPEKEVIGWRAADGEAFSTANTGEIVVFEPFFYRGFSVPTNRYFKGSFALLQNRARSFESELRSSYRHFYPSL